MKRTTIWLDDRDRAAIKQVRERYGLSTDSDAVRFAVRVIAQAPRLEVILTDDQPR